MWPRVLELLSEVGREPTLGVLLGLRTGLSAGVEPPDSVKTRVSQIASRHLSWSVRTVGEQVLGLWA